MNVTFDSSEPIVDALRVKDLLAGLSDKRGKIARLIQTGELVPLRRGLYATTRDLHPFCLAASIYGPSYISYETALSYHGLIPEAVFEVTSATLKRPRRFENAYGRFCYHRIPREAYAIGIEQVTESGIPFLIASATKALCDRIALESRIRSMVDVRRWLTLMRLDEIFEIDQTVLANCALHYGSPAVRQLHRTVETHGGIAT